MPPDVPSFQTFGRVRVEIASELEYAVIDEGAGDPVVLLHGFPDSADLWRHQIPALVEAGFRVVAPDLRGFGASSRPVDVRDYRLTRIVGDVSMLMRALEIDRAHLVGHDWGAAVAWAVAALMPSNVDHLVPISVGHPSAVPVPSIEQRRRAWYVLLYQFPDVAERLLARDDWQLFRECHVESPDLERYVRELSRPGALTAALNWYRANKDPALELGSRTLLPPVEVPTMGIWGEGDVALLEEGMRESWTQVRAPWRYENISRAGHWVPLNAPQRLNELLLSFLGMHDTPRAAPRARRFAQCG